MKVIDLKVDKSRNRREIPTKTVMPAEKRRKMDINRRVLQTDEKKEKWNIAMLKEIKERQELVKELENLEETEDPVGDRKEGKPELEVENEKGDEGRNEDSKDLTESPGAMFSENSVGSRF